MANMSFNIENDVLYTFEEVQDLLKVSKSQLRTVLNNGELKAFKVGKYKWRIPKDSLDEYIKKKWN